MVDKMKTTSQNKSLSIIPKGITQNQLINFSNKRYNMNIPQLLFGNKIIKNKIFDITFT